MQSIPYNKMNGTSSAQTVVPGLAAPWERVRDAESRPPSFPPLNDPGHRVCATNSAVTNCPNASDDKIRERLT